MFFCQKRLISVEADTDFICFRCGLVVSCCVAQWNHHTWIISIVHELWMGLQDTTVNDYTKTLLARHLYSGHFQNAIQCCMRCNMCSVDTNLSHFTECPCCIAQSTWVIGHHSGVSSKINIHQLNSYPRMCTLMVSLYFTHQIILYGTIPRWRQGTQRGHQLFLVSVLRSAL